MAAADIPEEAVNRAADAITIAANHFEAGETESSATRFARAALEAAAPLLAEAWGLDPDPPSAAALRAYLRSRGWTERPPGEAGSLFVLPGTSADVAVLHEGSDDRGFLAETLKRVAEAEGRTPWQVARDIPEVPGAQELQ